jgi:hypothetical protein
MMPYVDEILALASVIIYERGIFGTVRGVVRKD